MTAKELDKFMEVFRSADMEIYSKDHLENIIWDFETALKAIGMNDLAYQLVMLACEIANIDDAEVDALAIF